MKTIALLFAVGTFVLAGCSPAQNAVNTSSHKAAIEAVFDQRAKLETKEGSISYFSKKDLPGVMAIKVQNCPADFRSAWFDYLVQVQNLHTRAERVAMFATTAGKPVSGVAALVKFAASDPGLGKYLLGAVDRVDDAWDKLERTAMNYDVMPER